MTSVAPVSVVLAAHDLTAVTAPAVHRPAQVGRRPQRPQKPCRRPHTVPCEDDPDLFFPVSDSGPALLQIAEAKALCHRCSRTSACLEWALEAGADEGVWGGMTSDERRAVQRRRRARAGEVRR